MNIQEKGEMHLLPELPKRKLGSTGLLVTPLCIGTAALGNMPEDFGFTVSEEQAKATLRRAFQSPVNFFDTASLYGESERIIGEVIEEIGGLPKGVVLATKADRNPETNNFSGEQIKRSIESSLQRLRLAKLSLVYIHDPEKTTFANVMSSQGPLEILRRYKEQGIIDHIGIAGGQIKLMMEYVETGAFEVVLTHNRHTLLYRTADPLLSMAFEKGVGIVNAAPFGSGLLIDDSPNARYAYKQASEDILERTRKIKAICKKYGISLKAAALQFSAGDPRITSTIVGVVNPEQIEEDLSLLNCEIPQDLWKEINKYAISRGDPEI